MSNPTILERLTALHTQISNPGHVYIKMPSGQFHGTYDEVAPREHQRKGVTRFTMMAAQQMLADPERDYLRGATLVPCDHMASLAALNSVSRKKCQTC